MPKQNYEFIFSLRKKLNKKEIEQLDYTSSEVSYSCFEKKQEVYFSLPSCDLFTALFRAISLLDSLRFKYFRIDIGPFPEPDFQFLCTRCESAYILTKKEFDSTNYTTCSECSYRNPKKEPYRKIRSRK